MAPYEGGAFSNVNHRYTSFTIGHLAEETLSTRPARLKGFQLVVNPKEYSGPVFQVPYVCDHAACAIIGHAIMADYTESLKPTRRRCWDFLWTDSGHYITFVRI